VTVTNYKFKLKMSRVVLSLFLFCAAVYLYWQQIGTLLFRRHVTVYLTT